MAQVSNEQFLFSCIDNSNGGTVDWQKVAEQCDIVSKGAAAIKFKRMKEKFGTVSGGKATPSKKDAMADDGDGEETPKKKRAPRTTPGKKGSAKKRKMEQDDGDETPEENTVKEEVVEEES